MAVPTKQERLAKNKRFNWYKSDFDYEVRIDPTLAHNLLCLLESAQQTNGDVVIVIDGEEGCQPAGSKVLMSTGVWKNIEDVKVGDRIISPNSDYTSTTIETVESVCDWYSENNYDVSTLNRNNQKLYTCSDNHLIPLNIRYIPRNGNERKCSTSVWQQKNYRADYLSRRSKSFLTNTTTPLCPEIYQFDNAVKQKVDPYLLGLFLGDGTSSGNFNITSNDQEIIDYCVNEGIVTSIGSKKGTTAKTVRITKKSELYKYIVNNKLLGKKSGDKFIPPAALTETPEFRLQLLAGLIDSDGYLSRKASYSICTKSNQLSKDIEYLVHSLGGRSTGYKISKSIKSINFTGEYNNVTVNLSKQIPCILQRNIKSSFFYLSGNRVSLKVTKSEPQFVYGFSITGQSKLYVTDNWTVTHNSGKSTLARQIGRLLDPTLTEKRIEFDPEAAKEAHFQGIPPLSSREFVPKLYRAGHYEGKPWQVILLDESAKLDRKRTMASASVEFMGFITQSRQLHKVFIIILPNVHMLDGYIAEHRTVALIHTFKYKKTTMGFYKWYSRRHIKRMFAADMHRQKLYSRDCSFQGRFSGKEPFDTSAYEKKKATALEVYRKQDDPNNKEMTKEEVLMLNEEFAVLKCLKDRKIDQPSVYKALNIDRARWSEIKKRVIKKYNLGPEPPTGTAARIVRKGVFMADLVNSIQKSDAREHDVEEYSFNTEENE